MSPEKVAFSRTEKKVRLVVDGLKAREGNVPSNYSAKTESPIYLGGMPSLKVQVNAKAHDADVNSF